jgi:uncharacterized protein (UPF0332 family)
MTDDIRIMVQYRLQRAHEAIEEARLLQQSQFYNTVANRLYYACFYAVSALLLLHHLKAATHAGVRNQFAQHFVRTGLATGDMNTLYSELFRFREKSDYEDFFRLTADEANRLLQQTPPFIDAIERLIDAQLSAES